MEDKVQQTIVMVERFPDGNGGMKKVPKGKYCAQAAHAAMSFMSKKWRVKDFTLSDEEEYWIDNSFVKVCLSVPEEAGLMVVYNAAMEAGLTVKLITDNGLTEFGCTPTITCLCIGPHYKSKIDPITKDLKLFQ